MVMLTVDAGRIFKEVWERCKAHEGYQRLKKQFLVEQKEWERNQKDLIKTEPETKEDEHLDRSHVPKKRRTRTEIKKEAFD
jgi:Skp family chaperone for outer membrane proteins